jgi:hypothetical protein
VKRRWQFCKNGSWRGPVVWTRPLFHEGPAVTVTAVTREERRKNLKRIARL